MPSMTRLTPCCIKEAIDENRLKCKVNGAGPNVSCTDRIDPKILKLHRTPSHSVAYCVGVSNRQGWDMPKNYRMLDKDQLSAADRLFASTVIHEMAKKGRSPVFSRLLTQIGLDGIFVGSKSVGDVFDSIFSMLKMESYRHEYTYKTAITQKLFLGVHSINTASMLTEFRVGSSKADVVILNGTASAYEIKSERDTLDRLQRQIEAYRRVFARVNVITSLNHLDEVQELIEADIGILILNKNYALSVVRKADNNPRRIDVGAVFDSIQLHESKRILQLSGVEVPNLPNTQQYTALREIFKSLPPELVHMQMVKVLKESRSLLPIKDLLSSLPESLRAAVLSTPLRQKDHRRILSAVETPIREALSWA